MNGVGTVNGVESHGGAGSAVGQPGYSQTGDFVGTGPAVVNANANAPGLPPPSVARNIPCKFFPNCRYGDSCAFAHIAAPGFPTGPAAPQDAPLNQSVGPSSHSQANGPPVQQYAGGFYYPAPPQPTSPIDPHHQQGGMPMEYAAYAAAMSPGYGPMHAGHHPYFHPAAHYQRNPYEQYPQQFLPPGPGYHYMPGPNGEMQPVPNAPRASFQQSQLQQSRSARSSPTDQLSSSAGGRLAPAPSSASSSSPVSPVAVAQLSSVPTSSSPAPATSVSPSQTPSAGESLLSLAQSGVQATPPASSSSEAANHSRNISLHTFFQTSAEDASEAVGSPPAAATVQSREAPPVAASQHPVVPQNPSADVAQQSNAPVQPLSNGHAHRKQSSVSGPRSHEHHPEYRTAPRPSGVNRPHFDQPISKTPCNFFGENHCRAGDLCPFAHVLRDGTDAKALRRNIIGPDGTEADPADVQSFQRSDKIRREKRFAEGRSAGPGYRPREQSYPPTNGFRDGQQRGRPYGNGSGSEAPMVDANGAIRSMPRQSRSTDSSSLGIGQNGRSGAPATRSQQRVPTGSDFPALAQPTSPEASDIPNKASESDAAQLTSAKVADVSVPTMDKAEDERSSTPAKLASSFASAAARGAAAPVVSATKRQARPAPTNARTASTETPVVPEPVIAVPTPVQTIAV